LPSALYVIFFVYIKLGSIVLVDMTHKKQQNQTTTQMAYKRK